MKLLRALAASLGQSARNNLKLKGEQKFCSPYFYISERGIAMGSFREIDPAQFKRCYLDVPYASEDPRQVLDLWLPNEGEGPFPLIVFVHGGGWVSGNKRENTMPGVFKLPSQGYAVACVEYRLVPDVRWPEPLEDVRAAIRFLRAHAAEYNLNAENIALMGNSAGGHLACMVAALAGRPIMNGRRYGNLDQSDAAQCLISVYSPTDMYQLDLCDRTTPEDQAAATDGHTARGDTGEKGMGKMHNQLMGVSCIDNPEIAATASPIKFVNRNFPPAYFLQGVQDHIIPYTQSVAMVRMVNETCGEDHARLKLFPNADHGAEEMKTDEEINLILDFIDQHIWPGKHERTPLPKEIAVL